MRPLLLALAALLLLVVPDSALGSNFGRMFPDLPPYTIPSDQRLADLAQEQFDPGEDDLDNEDNLNNPAGITAGFTYFGQFIDHDLTRDEFASATDDVDPTTLPNERTSRLDLDSLYGNGPTASPELYDGAKLLKVQDPNPNGVLDVPREEDGTAILGDSRDDENALIAQLHAAFIRYHNEWVDRGRTFEQAQQLTRWAYQWLVANVYLPEVLGQDAVDRVLQEDGTVLHPDYDEGNPLDPSTPAEFSVASFRFGHSQVRDAYDVNDLGGQDNLFPVFSFDPAEEDLRGGGNVPANRIIDWNEFFIIDGAEEFEGNISRAIDTRISEALFKLPIPGAEATGDNVLAFRNMARGTSYGLPSGQDVSRALGIKPLSNGRIGLGKGFGREAPLWYYILAESEIREDGERLGDVGATINAQVILTQLADDPGSYLSNQPEFIPSVPGQVGEFDIGEFLRFAGVTDPVGEEVEEEAEE